MRDDVFVEIAAVYLVTALRMLPLVTSMTANYSRMRTLSDSIDRIFFTVGRPVADTVLFSSLPNLYVTILKLSFVLMV